MIADHTPISRTPASITLSLRINSHILLAFLPLLRDGDWPGQKIEDRAALKGVWVEQNAQGQITFVGSNGHQLLVISPKSERSPGEPLRASTQFMIPLACLAYLQRWTVSHVIVKWDALNEVVRVDYTEHTAPDIFTDQPADKLKWRHLFTQAQNNHRPDHCMDVRQFALWQKVFSTLQLDSPAIIRTRLVDLPPLAEGTPSCAIISPCTEHKHLNVLGMQVLNLSPAEETTICPAWL